MWHLNATTETEVVKPQIVLMEFHIAETTTTPVTTAGTTTRGFYMTCLMVTRESNCLKLAKKL